MARENKPSRKAKGVTQEEFIDFMKRAQRAVEVQLQEPTARQLWEEKVGKLGTAGCGPIYSFDHPPIHGGKKPGVVMCALGLTLRDHLMLPTHSCDIHRVIEHTHARLVDAFQKWMYDDSTAYNLDTYKRALEFLFYHGNGVAAASVIESDVLGTRGKHGLAELFEEVARLGGACPEKHFR
jgi:hypothetical protein